MATSTAPSIDPEAVKAAQAALDSMPASADAPGVDKIRELLFGNQMQDYDRRFSVLEDRFQQRLRDMEGGVVPQPWKHGVLDQEAAGIDRRPGPPGAGSAREADKELGRGLREQIQGLEKRFGQVSDQLAASSGNSPNVSATNPRRCETKYGGGTRTTRATIERMFSELSNVKTDRNLLAGLFVEIARCLNQDMTSQGGNRQRS